MLKSMIRGAVICVAVAGLSQVFAGESVSASYALSRSKDVPFGFTLDLGITEALERLGEREKIMVAASYYADPSKAGEAHADETGRIDLGTETVQVAAKPGIVRITGDQIRRGSLQWIAGDIRVNVNIYTARLSSKDNLIDCDFIDGPLVDAIAAEPVFLRCALISERLQTQARP